MISGVPAKVVGLAPEMSNQYRKKKGSPVFGIPLDDVLVAYSQEPNSLPIIVSEITSYLKRHGMFPIRPSIMLSIVFPVLHVNWSWYTTHRDTDNPLVFPLLLLQSKALVSELIFIKSGGENAVNSMRKAYTNRTFIGAEKLAHFDPFKSTGNSRNLEHATSL